MERQRYNQLVILNEEMRKGMFLWRSAPDNPDAVRKVKDSLAEASRIRARLFIKVDDQVFKNSEAARSMSREDLQSLARHEEGVWVFSFVGKSEPSKYRITIANLTDGHIDESRRGIIDKYNFVIQKRSGEGFATIGIFRPHEIKSLGVK